MKVLKRINTDVLLIVGLLAFTFLTLNQAYSQPGDDDKTLSPFFQVIGDSTARMPLKHTGAEVNLAGVIADVSVNQVYVNEGKTTIEAIYVFPASTKAAVYNMEMFVGNRRITAKVEEKGKAKQMYEDAKSEGKTASLLQQERPNVFTMNVGNIQPGDTITVRMSYTELLVPEGGVYEFVYPTVVGPRYTSNPDVLLASLEDVPTSSNSENWTQNPYLHEGTDPPYTFDITACIRGGMPISMAQVPSHNTDITFEGENTVKVNLKKSDANRGNKDFILQYRLAGDKIETGVLLYPGEKENFFLAMVQPPKKVTPENIPDREYIFVVDVSGSMHGFPLEVSKTLLKDLIGNLNPQDKFNVILFAGGSSMLSSTSLDANQANINKAISHINNQTGGGGTELLSALKKAVNLPETEGYSRSIVLATDGFIGADKQAIDYIRENLNKTNFFPFGIGSSVNRFLIEGLARVGLGEPFVVTTPNEAPGKADKFRQYIQSPVLTNIKVAYENVEVYDVEPYAIPDVLAERPIIIFGKYKGDAKGQIKLNGTSGNGKYEVVLDMDNAVASVENDALMYLWARKKIAFLDDYKQLGNAPGVEEEVTKLGLDYNLLTAYTSFIAIDEERRSDGTYEKVVQPLPLPEGVSDYATDNYNVGMVTGSSYGYGSGISGNRNGSQKQAFAPPPMSEDIEMVEEELDEVFAPEEPIADTISLISAEVSYPGGETALTKWIEQHIQIPEEAEAQGIQGTVYVELQINEKGKVVAVKLLRGMHPLLDKEALKLAKQIPDFKPKQVNGQPVKSTYTVAFPFRLK